MKKPTYPTPVAAVMHAARYHGTPEKSRISLVDMVPDSSGADNRAAASRYGKGTAPKFPRDVNIIRRCEDLTGLKAHLTVTAEGWVCEMIQEE